MCQTFSLGPNLRYFHVFQPKNLTISIFFAYINITFPNLGYHASTFFKHCSCKFQVFKDHLWMPHNYEFKICSLLAHCICFILYC